MTDHLYIDTADRKRIVTRWVVVTLWALHIWATVIIAAAIFSPNPSDMLSAMFSTVCFGIGATIGILLVDRASDILLARFAVPPAKVEEVVTHTVTTTQPETEGAKP